MKRILFLLPILAIAACDRPKCTNDNPVFEEYGPKSNEYKGELVKQLQTRHFEGVRYWVDKYVEIDGKPFMTVFIQADGLCAQGYLDIKNPNKLPQYKNVKGISYSGAEIKGLQYKIDTIDGKIVFLWEEGKIID